MKRTKAQRVLAAACGPALGVLLAVPLGGLLAGAAGADPCYTGCTSPSSGITNTPAVTTSDGGSTTTADVQRPRVHGSRHRRDGGHRCRGDRCWRGSRPRPPADRLNHSQRSAREQSECRRSRSAETYSIGSGAGRSPNRDRSRARAAGSRLARAARSSRERTSLVLAVAVAVFAPAVLQWPVAVFVLGVLGVCALRGQYASRITLSVSKDIGHVGGGSGGAAHRDRGLRRLRPAGPRRSCWWASPRCACS